MSTDRVRGLGFVVRGCSGGGSLGLGIRNVLRRFRVQQRLRSPDEASDFMMVASIRMMVLIMAFIARTAHRGSYVQIE